MIVLYCGKPRFISLPVSPPIYGSKSAKFQLCTTASLRSADVFPVVASLGGREATTGNTSAVRPKYNNFHANCTAIFVVCFCFFRNPEAEIMLTICNNNTTQYTKKKKKEQHVDLYGDIRGWSPIQFLTPTDMA